MADAGETTAGDALATALGERFGETSRRARFARCAMAMARGDGEEAEKIIREIESVSYTHLTLPTILLV